MKKKDLELKCPDCGSRLRVDCETGEVIAHGQEEKPDDLLDVARRLEGRHEAKSNAFDDALSAEKSRKQDLDDLFKKASDKNRDSDDDDEKVDNPLDDRWR